MAALGQISNVYEDQPYRDIENVSRLQSAQSLGYGDRAAAYADPFMGERANYQARLRDLIANPGSQESSPFFKYLMETQMNQVKANNAGRGLSKSGRGAMALQDRAASVATQSYFPQVEALSRLAMSGSSPAAAAISYERGTGRSMDYAQMAAAARAAGQQKPPARPSEPTTPWWQQNTSRGGALPSGGAMPYNSGLPGGMSGEVNTWTPGYTPSAEAGTGYMLGNNTNAAFGGGTTDTYSAEPQSFVGGGGDYSIPSYNYDDFGGGGDIYDYGGYDSYGGE